MMSPMIKILVLDDDPVRHRAFDVVLRDCQVDVVVHSQNITGAARMLDVLLEAGVPVLDRPFSLGMLQDLAHDIRSRVPGISRSRSKRAR